MSFPTSCGFDRRRVVAASILGVSAMAMNGGAVAQSSGAVAATAYINGNVITVDEKFSRAQAFAVAGGKFIAVGSNADVRKLAGSGARIVDLRGLSVLPGFIDTHPHTVHRGMGYADDPSLNGLRSVENIVDRIRETAAKVAPGAWIVTGPMGEAPDHFNLPDGLKENRWPTRADLDRAAPNNPVYIPTPAYWPLPSIFNSAALTQLGVNRDTPAMPGVTIMKDAAGDPTGIIYGVTFYNAGSPIFRKLMGSIPRPADERVFAGASKAFAENVAAGVTTTYEAHGNTFIPLLRKLKDAGRLPSRMVSAYEIPARMSVDEIDAWMINLKDALGEGSGDDDFKVVGATVSLDGPAQFGLAQMREPYLNPFGQLGNGASVVDAQKLKAIARLAAKHDLRLNVQAAGGGACDLTIAVLDEVNKEYPLRGRGWILQHFQHPSQENIARIAALGLFVQTYASTDYSKGAETYVKRFPGSDLWKSVVPYRWYFDAGVEPAGSSDGAHFQPAFQIWETLVRVDGRTGQSLLTPEKTVTLQEAIRIHTINGARLLKMADRLGSIEPGKLADFAVLDRDLLNVPTAQIKDTNVVLTAVGGRVVHDPKNLVGAHTGE